MEKTKSENAADKARRMLEQLLVEHPTYTGKLVLNFHQGDLSDKAALEHALTPRRTELGASQN